MSLRGRQKRVYAKKRGPQPCGITYARFRSGWVYADAYEHIAFTSKYRPSQKRVIQHMAKLKRDEWAEHQRRCSAPEPTAAERASWPVVDPADFMDGLPRSKKMSGLRGGGSRSRKRVRNAPRFAWQLEAQAKKCGSHFFDADTKRFFGSRISEKTHPSCRGTYFVTSEKRPRSSESRGYTVRLAQGACNIRKVGSFQQYDTLAQAHGAARRLAARGCGKKKR